MFSLCVCVCIGSNEKNSQWIGSRRSIDRYQPYEINLMMEQRNEYKIKISQALYWPHRYNSSTPQPTMDDQHPIV